MRNLFSHHLHLKPHILYRIDHCIYNKSLKKDSSSTSLGKVTHPTKPKQAALLCDDDDVDVIC
jgi:hypothetical protein